MTPVTPCSIDEAAAAIRDAPGIRFEGGRTKASWGNFVDQGETMLLTRGLDAIVEHNAGDLTAVLDSGVRFADAQEHFARAGQMFAVDPPNVGGATIGGIVATADSGPLRHRYGAVRDLIVGATLVLADGTVARSGGKVIKNVAGYDLAKLFCGSFGTLGLIARVAVRLHPRAPRTLTLSAESSDLATLRDVSVTLALLPLELDCLDLAYSSGKGRVLARFAGADPDGRLEAAGRALRKHRVDVHAIDDDATVWEDQRAAQRSSGGVVMKLSGLPSDSDRIMRTADEVAGRIVGRAAMGLYWLTIEGDDSQLVSDIEQIRNALPGFNCVVQDAPIAVRQKVDVWGDDGNGRMQLMRRVKRHFDPTAKCNPGLFVGGI